METAVTQKIDAKKKSQPVTENLAEMLSSLENELGSSIGMPLFLQRSPVNSASSRSDLKGYTQLSENLQDNSLQIGQPNDIYEQEADNIAQRATQLSSSTIPLQPTTQQTRGIQRKASTGIASSESSTNAEPSHASSSGIPLSTKVRERVEPLLGRDLSHVQVHADASAQETAKHLQAKAFTHRNHIWLGENQNPDDVPLLAHEATHVVQQEDGAGSLGGSNHSAVSESPISASSVPSIQRKLTPTSSTVEPTSSAALVTPTTFTPVTGDPSSISTTSSPTATSTEPNQSVDPQLQAATKPEAKPPAPNSQASSSDSQANPSADATQKSAGADSSHTATPDAEGRIVAPQAPDLSVPPVPPPTGMDALGTGEIALIDEELAEHQRWQGALGRVGTAASLGRAEFLAEAAGGGLLNGFASGAAMGLGIGIAGRAFKFIPYVGAIIGGGFALHGLAHRDWSNTAATIGNIGQGNSTYEVLANTLAAVAEAIDVVSNIMNVVAGITGVLATACTVAAAALGVAAIFTLGATAGLAFALGEAAVTLGEITLAISEVTNVLDIINSVILQPCILLFRALHSFTTEADPREVEAQGAGLGQAASTAGAFFGARAGGHLAEGSQTPGKDPLPHPEGSAHPDAPPPAASGEGPVVHFESPPVSADTPVSSTTSITPIDAPAPHIDSAPVTPIETPVAQSTSVTPVDAPVVPVSSTTPPHVDIPTPHSDAAPVAPIDAPAGQSAHEAQRSAEIREVMLERIVETRNMSSSGGLVEPEMQKVPGKRVPSLQRGEKDPSTFEVPRPVKSWQRRTSKQASREALKEALESGIHDPRTAATAEDLPLDTQLALADPEFRKNNPDIAKEARGIVEFSHEPRIVDDPVDAHKASSGTERSITTHREAVHGSDVTRPLETAQPLDPDFEKTWGYQLLPKRKPPTVTTDPMIRRQSQQMAQNYRRQAQQLRKRAQRSPRQSDRLGQQADGLERMANAYDQFAQQMHAQPTATPANSPPPENMTISLPTNPIKITPTQTPSTPEAVTTSQTITSTPVISSEQSVTSAPITSSSVEPPVSPTLTPTVIPTTSPTIPVPSTIPIPGSTPTSTTPTSSVRTPPPSVPSTLRQIGTMLLPEFFGPEGEAMTLSQRQVAHRAQFTATNQPTQGVERVNPKYSAPPGTPQQLEALNAEIENILTARARTEQATTQMAQQVDHHQAQQQPIQQAIQDAGQALSANQAHQEAVARHQQTNQAQQQRQQEAQTLVSGYPSRATGIAILTVPLAAFEGFTDLASELPGSAGAKMSEMNKDSRKLQDSFAQMAVNMAAQAAAQPARQESLQQDQTRLQATNQQSTTTQQDFHTAQDGAQTMQQNNDTRLDQAQAAKTEADNQTTDLNQAAEIKQQKATTLSQELQAWASAHKAARHTAITETQERLQKQGYIVHTKDNH
jgi:Domain of unknown function (DUF4157)